MHQTAKKAFEDPGLKKLPSIASLNSEFGKSVAENKILYQEYCNARTEMNEPIIAKRNVERILGIEPNKTDINRKRQRYEVNKWQLRCS